MTVTQAIQERRSIRKFKSIPLGRDVLEEILLAGIQAPSSKNRQPWHFVVVTEQEKQAMLHTIYQGLSREEAGIPMLPNSSQYIQSAYRTLQIMQQAPATVFVLNSLGKHKALSKNMEEECYSLANIQSIGAAIENMILKATELGIGSLWICDIFFAYEEVAQWLQTDRQIVAAISFGYSEESPYPRPRKALEEAVEWR